eukprot:593871-Pleurochrysis_carterae.AAC.1
MFTTAYDGRSAVLRRFGAKVAGQGERGAKWICNDGSVVAGGATLEETLVDRVMKQIVGIASSVRRMVVNGVA